MPTPTPQDETAESLFAAWLEQIEAGERADFEELCREHSRHGVRLRALRRRLEWLDGAWARAGHEATHASPRGQDPASVKAPPRPLEGDWPVEVDAPREVLEHLVDKPPASNRYAILDPIAHGGMGTVLRVWDRELRRPLAMKVMLTRGLASGPAGTPPADERILARFLEEAQVTGQLDHPGIVPVHEVVLAAEGRIGFTMKLVHGKTLREVFDELACGEGDWTQARVLRLLLRACEALSYAHAKGVIHRDLKPSNVMVGRFGEVYVMDWGLARVRGQAGLRHVRPCTELERAPETAGNGHDSPLWTMEGDVIGTPAYMPPEQARGDQEAVGPHSDVYAVGAMLYHLLAGHMPFVPTGTSASGRSVLARVLAGPPRPLHEVAPHAPPELVALCERAMSREESRRYPDMSALSADLAAYVEGRVVQAYETGTWAEARKWIQRNRPLAGALAAVAVALVAGGLAFAFKAREATRHADDVFRLHALQDVQDLLDQAGSDALWPAHPDRIPALEAWIARARTLVADLHAFEAKREQLRTLAVPQTPDERDREQATHPDHPTMIALESQIEALRTALEQRRSGEHHETSRLLQSLADVSEDPRTLNRQAWWRVRPDRSVFGCEAEGLGLGQRALELVGDDPSLRAAIEDTLAWAWFALGRDEEGLQFARRALESAPLSEKEEYAAGLARIEAATGWARSPRGLQAFEDYLDLLEEDAQLLRERVEQRTEWSFAPSSPSETRWWHGQLTTLIEKLGTLRSLLSGSAQVAGFGWSIPRRLDVARALEAGFAPDGPHARAWADALPAIRAAYPGLDLEPQMGLVPIGPDPRSGLWEFAHLMSGTPVRRTPEDGTLERTEETGLVLVLLPGGTFLMGAQSRDPAGPNYDPLARDWEAPVHEVRLSPFLLSKYEMTRGQWSRLTGEDPAFVAGISGNSMQLPVQNISWQDCFDWLPRAGLTLPSEARWEYAARAGTDTPWFTGVERSSVSENHAANLADETAARAGLDQPDVQRDAEPWDGFAAYAPVGSFTANPFGLHDVLGNVAEYCLDGFVAQFYASSPWRDPVGTWQGTRRVFVRGGAWYENALHVRVSRRLDRLTESVNSGDGVRPARVLDCTGPDVR